jgi:hypothetical protein
MRAAYTFAMLARIVVLAVLFGFAQPARAQVRITMHDGLVSLSATNATVRQILSEWARVGQATIVNGDQVTGAPVTIQFVELPESQALDIVLRSVSGYLAAPRPTRIPNGSRYDRIIVMPASAPTRTTSSVAGPTASPPPFSLPRPPGAPAISDDDALRSAPPPAPPLFQQPAPGILNAVPPAGAQDAPSPAPVSRPASSPGTFATPGGVSVPGMIVPAPTPATPAPSQSPTSLQPGA